MKTSPMIDVMIPDHKTAFKEKFPLTVGLFCVRTIFLSKSTSYQLLRINAPEMTSVLPNMVNRKRPQ